MNQTVWFWVNITKIECLGQKMDHFLSSRFWVDIVIKMLSLVVRTNIPWSQSIYTSRKLDLSRWQIDYLSTFINFPLRFCASFFKARYTENWKDLDNNCISKESSSFWDVNEVNRRISSISTSFQHLKWINNFGFARIWIQSSTD